MYLILGIKTADSASVMKHRPLLFCKQTSAVFFVFYQVSTNFSTIGFLPIFYQKSLNLRFFRFFAISRVLAFLPPESIVKYGSKCSLMNFCLALSGLGWDYSIKAIKHQCYFSHLFVFCVYSQIRMCFFVKHFNSRF